MESSYEETELMDEKLQATVNDVHDYWNTHTLGFQYVTDKSIKPRDARIFRAHSPVDEPIQVSVDHGAH